MRIRLSLFGLDVLDLELSTEPTSPGLEDDAARDLSGGTTGATPMGFVSRMERPHEADVPDRDW